MILLSSLLGPAKPPVASQTDINSAGGLFRLVEYGGSLVAEAVEGIGSLQIQDGERCLICLSDYEVAEEVRELGKCKHVFHKECIDQVCRPVPVPCIILHTNCRLVVNYRAKLVSPMPRRRRPRNSSNSRNPGGWFCPRCTCPRARSNGCLNIAMCLNLTFESLSCFSIKRLLRASNDSCFCHGYPLCILVLRIAWVLLCPRHWRVVLAA